MDNLWNIATIKSVMEKHGFTFSKALGQNFLVNPSVCPKIAELGNAKKGFGVLEIGTGIGVLTNELAKRADKVAAIEIDKRLIPVLQETLAEYDNVKIINDDVMKVDLAKLIRTEFAGLDVAVCANLPYYITSPVIMTLLEQRLPIKTITVMVQKEVAINYFANARVLFNVSRGSFMPPPNVDSCVVQFELRDKTPQGVSDEEFFFKVARGAFSQRRKTLCNSVSSALCIDKSITAAAIEQAGLDPSVRPEKLSMQQLILFSENLKRLI